MKEPKKPHEVKLGAPITDPKPLRDAIHIAVAPVEAGEVLTPGEQVGFDEEGKACAAGPTVEPLGIVDPFLRKNVEVGERFWLMLFPQTITSLRHEWTHPTFDALSKGSQEKQEAEEWLKAYAEEAGISYARLMGATQEFIEYGEEYVFDYDTPQVCYDKREEFWQRFAQATGIKVKEGTEGNFFRCAC